MRRMASSRVRTPRRADVLGEHAGIGPIRARVRIADAEFGDAPVAGDGGKRITHEAFDIGFAHEVVDHGCSARVHQIEDGLDLIFGAGRAAFEGIDFRDGLAFVRGVGSEARHGGEGIIGLAHFGQVLLHLEGDFAAGVGVGEALFDLASGERPAGKAYAEIGAGAIVGILVGDYVHAFTAESLDEGERLIAGAPDAAAVDFEM